MNTLDKLKLENIAREIEHTKGNIFYAGMTVCDQLLNKQISRVDIIIFGLMENDLRNILSKYGEVLELELGCFMLRDVNIVFNLPKYHNKKDGWVTRLNPFMTYIDYGKLHSFTIQSMLCDVLTGNLIDYYQGKNDLENEVIRFIKVEDTNDKEKVKMAKYLANELNYTYKEEAPHSAFL